MANQKYFLRIIAILNRVNRGDYPSQECLLEDLSEKGHQIETRTFERDKKTISEMFEIEILYDAFEKGYYIIVPHFL